MRRQRLALGALLAALATPALAPGASPPECALALNPPQDQRFSDRTETTRTLEEYLGSDFAGAVEPARPYWRGHCQIAFRLEGATGSSPPSRASRTTRPPSRSAVSAPRTS